MRFSFSALVGELVSVSKFNYSTMILIFSIVISRALASFMQYVGLIKEEFMDKDGKKEDLFKAKFHLLLARYRDLTRKPLFGKKVLDPLLSPSQSYRNYQYRARGALFIHC